MIFLFRLQKSRSF